MPEHNRGHNEGTIFQRKDGRWAGAISIGWQKGKWKKKTVYGKTRSDVQKKIHQLLHQQQHGIAVDSKKHTVETFVKAWLKDVVKRNVRPRTFDGYDQVVKDYIIPHLGKIALNKLNPQHVQRWINQLQDEKKSARTVLYCRSILRAALNQAMKWELIVRNPATLIDPPSYKRPEIVPLTPEQATSLCKAIEGDRLEALYLIALCLGLRKGEILALKWADIDSNKQTIKVSGTLQRIDKKLVITEPKTEKSRRTLPLPESIAQHLKAHHKRQFEERMKASTVWQETGLVFTNPDGSAIDQKTLSTWWYGILKKAQIERRRFHDLRHSCATFLFAQGVEARMVMEILGHSQLSLTMETYTHVLSESKVQAVNSVAAFIKKK